MAAKQLVELKDLIKLLLEKGYITPSSPPWGALWFLTRRRMVLNSCVWIIILWMRLPLRISTYCLGLMVCLIISMVCVCSRKLIFDWDRNNWRYKNVTFQRLPSFWGMVYTSERWYLLDWLKPWPTIWIWWTRTLWSMWTSLLWCSSMTYWCTLRMKKNMKNISLWCCRSFETIGCMPS
jgi:hypothetical protein